MAKKNDKKYGRTFFDLIGEHPRKTFFIFLSILIVAIFLIIFKIPFKVGNIEVGDKKQIIYDTIKQQQQQDKSIITDYPKLVKQVNTFRPKGNLNKVSVKSGDTFVKVQNQPSNINTGTNNGIIGNNASVNLNIGEVQRKLDEPFKQDLLTLINKGFNENKVNDHCIIVFAQQNNQEAINFSLQIQSFLYAKALSVHNEIIQYSYSPPIKGVMVSFGFKPHMEISNGNHKDNCISIIVGSQN